MHGLVAYVKEELPFSWNLPLENPVDSYLCFWLALLHSLSYFFFLYQSHFLCLYAWFLILFHLRKVSNDLTQMVSIPTWILTVLLFWICFFLLMLVFLLQWLSLHWEILIMLLS